MVMLLCWQQPAPSEFAGLDPTRYRIHPIRDTVSATSIARFDDEWFLTVGLPDSRPGIYQLVYRGEKPAPETTRRKRKPLKVGQVRVQSRQRRTREAAISPDVGFFAIPAKLTMKEDLRGLQSWRDDETMALIASRRFGNKPEEWAGRILLVNREYWFTQEVINLPESPLCLTKSYLCGLSHAIPLDENRILIFRDRDPSEAALLVKQGGLWTELRRWKLQVANRRLSISEVRLRGDSLYLLLKRRWQMGRISLKTLLANEDTRQQVEPVFDFSHFKREISSDNARLRYAGLAEGFDWDQQGNLFVLINTQGFSFYKIPQTDKDSADNRLLIFTKKP